MGTVTDLGTEEQKLGSCSGNGLGVEEAAECWLWVSCRAGKMVIEQFLHVLIMSFHVSHSEDWGFCGLRAAVV